MKASKKLLWKVPLSIIGGIVALILLILIAIPLFLSSDNLTRLTRKYGTEYLVNGRVDVDRADLTVWSTFPHAVLTLDSLRIVNTAIPDSVATVVSIDSFSGRINLAALLIGRISIGHAEIVRPCATLWTGADSTQTSLSILPAGEPSADSSSPLLLPDLRITSFRIVGDARARYISTPDSLNFALTLHRLNLDGRDEAPQYQLLTDATASLPSIISSPLRLSLDGGIGWKPSAPLQLSLHDFRIGVDSLRTRTSLRADFADGLRLDALDFELAPLPLQRLAELADSMPALAGKMPRLQTDATLELSARLLKPYVYNPDTLLLPDLALEARVNDAPLAIPAWYLTLTNLGADIDATISSRGLDASEVNLKRLRVTFPASDFNLIASATNLASDPALKGCFRGDVSFTNLNPRLWTLLKMRLRGSMDADIDFNTRLSDLTPAGFHRALLTGDALLRDFEALLPADTIDCRITRASVRFGSSDSFGGADSLLTASIKVDSLAAELPDMTLRLKNFAIGLGVSNTATSLDTTTITPMGGYLSVDRLTWRSVTDSTTAIVRKLAGGVSMRRYKGSERLPQFGAKLSAKRLVFADATTRASLRGVEISASAHKSAEIRRRRRSLSVTDSLRLASRRDSMLLAESKFERLDPGIDRSSVRLLRKYNVSGRILAKGGRVMTPLFPLRTGLTDFNVSFNADSVMLNSMTVTAGRSDFNLSGSITDIQRSLGRAHSSSPLRMVLDISSDTINVNQLTQAAFRGAAYAAKSDSLKALTASAPIDADDETLEAAAEQAASDETMAIVVPMNIDAALNIKARNIIYSDLALKDFRGGILVANGAANLRDLHAATDIGSVDLNMLYYAPTRSDVNFGLGLDLRRFNLGRVTEIIPTLDSIMPILNTLGGIIDVGISATTPVDSMMNIDLPRLRAMVHLTGDSLRVLDEKTFKTVSKWLLFRDKNKNMIDHMDVHLAVEENRLSLYPFMFDFDRYRIGVMGNNDMNLNLNYHVSILKSPIPFKFGINIKGTAENMKIRLGRARFKEDMAAETVQLSDTLRVNLAREIRDVFNRGTRAARLAPLDIRRPKTVDTPAEANDTLTAADSLYFKTNGLQL